MLSLDIDTPWRARAIIDLESLRHNLREIRLVAPSSKVMAVIKADAYGHGLETVCLAIHHDVDSFAVATIAEGVQCRNIQKNRPVVVLSELWRQAQLAYFDQYNMEVVVHNQQQAQWLKSYQGSPLSVWIKVDTGMNRLGIAVNELTDVYNMLHKLKGVRSLRIMSHLANADVMGDEYTRKQSKQFELATNEFNCDKSLANSAGIIAWPDTHYSWIRPGLIMYGAIPFEGCGKHHGLDKLNLRPVMQLQARLISTKIIDTDQPVGYGGVYRTQRESRIAMIGLGYGDGYPRLVDNRACVLINGKCAPIIGRVSMDMITVDITELDGANVGDGVTLWGECPSIEEVADWAGTIPYELLCKVTTRIPRVAKIDI